MAQLIPVLLPPIASFIYEGYCKESYYDWEVISLWRTPPLTAKNYSGAGPKTKLCKGSWSQLYSACWQLLVLTYNTLVCTAQHNVCSLCNAAASWSACVPNSPLRSCCPSNPHPLSTYTPDCSYQSLILCTWTASKGTELSCQLGTSFKHSHYPEIHFLMLHEIYQRNWWKLMNPMRLPKSPVKIHAISHPIFFKPPIVLKQNNQIILYAFHGISPSPLFS